jgi:hypothetical protein
MNRKRKNDPNNTAATIVALMTPLVYVMTYAIMHTLK